MSRVQLSINVSDFDAAVAFYSRLFGTGTGQAAAGVCQLRHRRPAAQAGAELARQRARRHDQPPGRRGRLDRRGHRRPRPGWPLRAWTPSPSPAPVCCYARQDKVWAHDPDGVAWEYYTVLEHIETP